MRRPIVIAIDGPGGAGKSTVGALLARRLGFFFFDTGALYRAVALRALDLGIDPSDEPRLADLVSQLDIVVRPPSVDDGRQCDVLLHGRDVSQAIRSPAVDAIVSAISAWPAVRQGLVALQRRQIQGPGTIMSGRDIGTVICPAADLKVYLLASARERARRRLAQSGGPPEQLDDVLEALERRDRSDSSRAYAPLARAEDAAVVDTDGATIEQVVERVLEMLERQGFGKPAPSAAHSPKCGRGG